MNFKASSKLSVKLTVDRILIFKEAPNVVYSGVTKVLGSPKDFEKNSENEFNSTEVDLSIPIEETLQFQEEKPDLVRQGTLKVVLG